MTVSPAPSSNPLLALLDLISSALVLFTPEGRVAFANRAAKKIPARPILSLPSDPQIKNLIRDISLGAGQRQVEVDIDVNSDEGMVPLRCTFAPRPIAGLVAMALTERLVLQTPAPADELSTPAPAPPPRMSLQQIMDLLEDELMGPLDSTASALRDLNLLDDHPAALAVQVLRERLDRLSDLIGIFGDDVLIGDDRMVMPDMVRDICQELAPLARASGTGFVLEGDKVDLPPVYGSQRLIRRALMECLRNAIEHAGKPSTIDEKALVRVRFHSAGHHLLINIRNLGVLPGVALERYAHGLFRPVEEPASAAEEPTLRIGLPMSHRILQLHGGRLRYDGTPGEIDVRLEIPTGARHQDTQQLDLLQAQLYAQDLSRLIARSRPRSPT
ncbi:sensor histidine kinase [Hydrogenophaga electricum]|uniref:histidine kinase n=1 Tax=Hydrogenophaga electricum TaxID=1230953 RepID=A0ABQ6C5I2_9BURK|nr:ATP-binding protein [Hydrogenophaga electricum]GLS15049.1 hypothetical protein GCM10007935_24820 [Hydrogenophaga electricum]